MLSKSRRSAFSGCSISRDMNRDALNALDQTVAIARKRAGGRIPVVAVAGPQGSGKTTLVRAYATFHPQTAHFSLDDVYLEASQRQKLGAGVHPLFATRGPPGTHDLALLGETLDALQSADPDSRTLLPAFDKTTDNPSPRARRPVFEGRPQIILVDGWCLGATAQSADALDKPINHLEAVEDERGKWRRAVDDHLTLPYSMAFQRLDAILYLRPPDFDVVLDWRCEQEESLLGRPLTPRDRERLARFIEHYERITRHMMAGGRRADIELQLDARRNVTEVRRITA
jgi:D-glycerate 3-kinase